MENHENTSLVKPASDSYSIFDKLDEQQIINADKAVKQKMVYKAKDHIELTSVGLKHIILEMAGRGMPLEIESSEVNLERDDPNDKETWMWRSKVVTRNLGTNYTTEGLSECPYLERGQYDPFGRTKAHSKAERNSWRKQIPETKIIALVQGAGDEETYEIDTPSEIEYCQCEKLVLNKLKTKCVTCNKAVNQYILSKHENKQEKIDA